MLGFLFYLFYTTCKTSSSSATFAIWIADTFIHEITSIYHHFNSYMANIVFVHESVNKIIYHTAVTDYKVLSYSCLL